MNEETRTVLHRSGDPAAGIEKCVPNAGRSAAEFTCARIHGIATDDQHERVRMPSPEMNSGSRPQIMPAPLHVAIVA